MCKSTKQMDYNVKDISHQAEMSHAKNQVQNKVQIKIPGKEVTV